MTRTIAVRVRRAAAIVLLVVAVVGCGVTTEDRPVRIDREEVPFDLLGETPPEPVPTSATPAPDDAVG